MAGPMRRMAPLAVAVVWALAFDVGPVHSQEEPAELTYVTSISCYGASADGGPPKGSEHHRTAMEAIVASHHPDTTIDQWDVVEQSASSVVYQLRPVPGSEGVEVRAGFANFGGGWLHETYSRLPKSVQHSAGG